MLGPGGALTHASPSAYILPHDQTSASWLACGWHEAPRPRRAVSFRGQAGLEAASKSPATQHRCVRDLIPHSRQIHMVYGDDRVVTALIPATHPVILLMRAPLVLVCHLALPTGARKQEDIASFLQGTLTQELGQDHNMEDVQCGVSFMPRTGVCGSLSSLCGMPISSCTLRGPCSGPHSSKKLRMRPYSSAERPLEAFVRPIVQVARPLHEPGSNISRFVQSESSSSCLDRGTVAAILHPATGRQGGLRSWNFTACP